MDQVTRAERPIWSETLPASLRRRLGQKLLIIPEEQQHVVNAFADTLSEAKRAEWIDRAGGHLPLSDAHPLIHAVHIAFSQHRPLALSPDAIWLVIAQGFSHHVAENAELLRGRLVRHAGKKDLEVKCWDLTLASFREAIAQFSALIQSETDPVLYETLICDFSTTGPEIRAASEVALMDTFSAYFSYTMMCVCGIPQITLGGELADWQRIRARVEVLATYDLEWWVSRLRPILDEFVLAAEGRPTQEFWQAIYKPQDAYGDKVATGWITDLFPYLEDPPARKRNPVFKYDRQNWALPVDQGVPTDFLNPAKGSVKLGSFPAGLSRAKVKISFKNRASIGVDFVAGFFGVTQSAADLTLSPLISWCVAEPSPQEAPAIF